MGAIKIMLNIRKKGQTTIEYIILITIILGAFLAVGNYFKRGLQGRWKAAVDDLGDQYDPRAADSSVRQTFVSNTVTTIVTLNNADGFWTSRQDLSNSIDRKTGTVSVGAY
jgi:uncharacterized protein (UPF0333 family)